jgi:hypothetical protein
MALSKLSKWDRDYLEYLIQRDENERAEERERREEERQRRASEKRRREMTTSDLFQGGDRYFWDFHLWPVKARSEESRIISVVCPDPSCGQVINYRVKPHPYPYLASRLRPNHVPWCEFQRAEREQWVDDWADVRREHHVVRHLTCAEASLALMLTKDHEAASRFRMVVMPDQDGMLLRRLV